jgi:hypothetical protein
MVISGSCPVDAVYHISSAQAYTYSSIDDVQSSVSPGQVYLGAATAAADPLDNWNSRTSGSTSDLSRVTYGNNTFVAVGNNGTIVTSPDGINWTSRTSGTTKSLYGVACGTGTFVALGEKTILQSDAITTGVTGANSAPSSTGTSGATTNSPPTGASAPLQLTAMTSGPDIVLNWWTPPSNISGMIGYYIYRGASPGGESALPLRDFFPVTQTTYTDTPSSSGTYYYIVKPVYNIFHFNYLC